MPEITAVRADELVGENWFAGYTAAVDLHEEPVTVEEFDAGARADALGHSEYAVFGGGLVVHGTMNLDADPCRSIYVVQGSLRVRRLMLGDAVLVVRGTVEAREWLFGGQTEGIFEVMGESIESPDAALMFQHIRTPLLVLYDRNRGRFMVRERGVPREPADLVADLLDEDVRSGIHADRLRERLCDGAPLFR